MQCDGRAGELLSDRRDGLAAEARDVVLAQERARTCMAAM
jgi:hypothetical protein